MLIDMRSIKNQRITKYKNLKLYLSIVICTLILSLYVSEQVLIISLERSINNTISDISEISNEIDHLGIKVAELSKGSRIKTIASMDLNMKMPEGTPQRLF
ncbi:hypothetical protein ACFL6H_03265 [Candidatus Latescibacterota bacterium]